MFFIIEKSKETIFELSQSAIRVNWFWLRIKMETQKIVKLLGDANNESSKLQQENCMLSMNKKT